MLRKMLRDLSEDLSYHDVKHTVDVIRAAGRLCYLEGIDAHNTALVRTAALFHDLGFCVRYMDNESVAADLAAQELPQFGYEAEDIDEIKGMIMATRIPHEPHTHLEQIICDADLDYLGREDFHPISENLKKEFMHHNIVQGEKEWDEVQVKFFELHRYFTKSARRMRADRKAAHLAVIKKRLEDQG